MAQRGIFGCRVASNCIRKCDLVFVCSFFNNDKLRKITRLHYLIDKCAVMTKDTSTTVGLFLQAIDLEVRYLSENVKQERLKGEIDKYLTHIDEVAQRYNPNRRIGRDDSLRRFRYEVASTTILIIAIDEWLKSKGLPDLASFATNGIREFLPLTDIPTAVRELCYRLSKSIGTPNEFSLLLKSASDIRFERSSKYLFSEYYTPPTVAKQIIHYAFPKNPEDLPHQRFIDPACGNGSLLALFCIAHFEVRQKPK